MDFASLGTGRDWTDRLRAGVVDLHAKHTPEYAYGISE